MNKDYDRLQKSFQALKSQNDELRTKMELLQLNEDSLKKELNKLKLRLSNRSSSSKPTLTRPQMDVSTQTQNMLVPSKSIKFNKGLLIFVSQLSSLSISGFTGDFFYITP